MSLYKKMYDVMCDTEAIEKTLEVGYGKNAYKAVSESAVLNMVKPLLKKHGLIIFPVEIDAMNREDRFLTKDGEASRLLTQVDAKYKIVDIETGEFEILATVGNGVDTQDKASGKAMTYGYKNMLQKTFMLFSGEDTDNQHSDEITKANTRQKPVDMEKLGKLNDLFEQLDPEAKSRALKFYKVDNIMSIDTGIIDSVMLTIQASLNKKKTK